MRPHQEEMALIGGLEQAAESSFSGLSGHASQKYRLDGMPMRMVMDKSRLVA
jgi:hypothetical protein